MGACAFCKTEYDIQFRNANSKYCIACIAVVKKQSQKSGREKRKKRMQGDDIDYIANQIYKTYKQRAPKRGLEFDLTIDFFKKHFRVNCYYCDEKITNIGFDRMDNSKGYIESNVVPCCTSCNRMKHAMTKAEFINRCASVAETLGLTK